MERPGNINVPTTLLPKADFPLTMLHVGRGFATCLIYDLADFAVVDARNLSKVLNNGVALYQAIK